MKLNVVDGGKYIGDANNILLLVLWYSAYLDKYCLSLNNITQNALGQLTDKF